MKEGRKGNWNGKEESSSESFRLKIRIKLKLLEKVIQVEQNKFLSVIVLNKLNP